LIGWIQNGSRDRLVELLIFAAPTASVLNLGLLSPRWRGVPAAQATSPLNPKGSANPK
jgi:hypothetical protein